MISMTPFFDSEKPIKQPTKRTLYQRLNERRTKDPHHFLRHARDPDTLAQLAYNSSVIEGRPVSLERLRDIARTHTDDDRPS
jgi:hypothetical protein